MKKNYELKIFVINNEVIIFLKNNKKNRFKYCMCNITSDFLLQFYSLTRVNALHSRVPDTDLTIVDTRTHFLSIGFLID